MIEYPVHRSEPHEQFIERASRVFPPETTATWSRLERAVFNSLMSELIYRHCYSAITDDMLHNIREDMEALVQQGGNQLPQYSVANCPR